MPADTIVGANASVTASNGEIQTILNVVQTWFFRQQVAGLNKQQASQGRVVVVACRILEGE